MPLGKKVTVLSSFFLTVAYKTYTKTCNVLIRKKPKKEKKSKQCLVSAEQNSDEHQSVTTTEVDLRKGSLFSEGKMFTMG